VTTIPNFFRGANNRRNAIPKIKVDNWVYDEDSTVKGAIVLLDGISYNSMSIDDVLDQNGFLIGGNEEDHQQLEKKREHWGPMVLMFLSFNNVGVLPMATSWPSLFNFMRAMLLKRA